MERIGAHGPLSDPSFRRLLYRLGERDLLNRPGLAELSSVYEAFDAAGEPEHSGPRAALEAAVQRGRRWLLDHMEDPAAERLARDLVDYEYAALGALVLGDYGALLGTQWTPPDAEGGGGMCVAWSAALMNWKPRSAARMRASPNFWRA